jgi:hypothetical protein
VAGHPMASHSGSITGFTSRAASYPRDSLIVVVLSNAQSFAPEPMERAISAYVLGLPDPGARSLPVSPRDAARLLGRYHAREFGFDLMVRYDAGALTGEVPGLGRFGLRRQTSDEYVSDDDHYIRFRFVGQAGHAQRVEMKEPGHEAMLDWRP